MVSANGYGGSHATRRQRNAGVCRCRQSRGDARHDFERDPGASERCRFLGSATEEQRIATLEANDAVARERQRDKLPLNRRLIRLRTMTDLSDRHQSCARAAIRQDLSADQMIMQYDISLSNELERAHRQETRISGTGAHQIHRSVRHRSASMTMLSRSSHRWNVSARLRRADR